MQKKTKTKRRSATMATKRTREEQSYRSDDEEQSNDFNISNSDSEEAVTNLPPKKKQRSQPKATRAPSNPPKEKKSAFEFGEEDVELIENAIVQYGLNYKVIWEKHYQNKTSQNRLKEFINCEQMKDVKECAKAGMFRQL